MLSFNKSSISSNIFSSKNLGNSQMKSKQGLGGVPIMGSKYKGLNVNSINSIRISGIINQSQIRSSSASQYWTNLLGISTNINPTQDPNLCLQSLGQGSMPRRLGA